MFVVLGEMTTGAYTTRLWYVSVHASSNWLTNYSKWTMLMQKGGGLYPFHNTPFWDLPKFKEADHNWKMWLLNLSQTSPGFYVSET